MINRKITRISVSLILVTGMILGITGCGKNAEVPNSSQDNGEPQAEDSFTAETPESFFPINGIVDDAANDTEEVTPVDSPDWVGELEAAKDANQLFVVAGIGGTTAYVSMHEKDGSGSWKEIMTTPGYIGKMGLGKTMEGDAMTPVGTFRFTDAFGIADDPGCSMPYKKVDDNDYWSGDQRDGYHYNEMVSIADLPDLDTDESEHIIDYTYEYQYCLNISYNLNGTPGKGSAIFLHCFGPYKPYTGGCISIPEDKMKTVMKNVDKDCVVVIDTVHNLAPSLYADWGLDDFIKYSADSSDFVLLSEEIPDAILEIRYYSTYNFVGERIDGYEEPVALLTKEAASALKKVSDDLAKKGYRLKIFDAYRPQKAVDHFIRWAQDPDDTKMKEYFYPELDKDVLFPQGYILEHSGHSRGSTVDLTLFDMNTEKEVDMGGTFDYFGELSHPDYTDITDEQYENRMILRDAMLAHGFKPLDEEWWHFTLKDEPYTDTYFTFPVSSESVK